MGPTAAPGRRAPRPDRRSRPLPNSTWLTRIEVVVAASRAAEEALGEAVERLGGDALDLDPALLLPARELAARAVELSVAGQDARAVRACRGAAVDQADEEIVRVGGEDDRVRLGGAELARDMDLRLGPDLVHHLVPFAVGEAGRVVPRLHVPVEARVGPEMMAVRREVQPRRIGAAGCG